MAVRGQQLDNPLRIEQLRHGFTAAIDAWVRDDKVQPPDSRYPRVVVRHLVPVSELSIKTIRCVDFPRFNYEVYRTDFGPEWTHGIVTEPPRVDGVYPTLVPQVNGDGLEIAGVHLPEIDVPLATHTGWNLRDPQIGFPDSRASFVGSYIPWTKSEIYKRYNSGEEWFGRFTLAAMNRIRERFLVIDDLPAILKRAGEEWDWANRE
jgi:hypothetical protein